MKIEPLLAKNTLKTMIVAPALAGMVATGAYAGGLATPQLEDEVISAEDDAGLPGWVVPAIAIVVVGALIASSNDDDDSAPGPSITSFGSLPD
ncbi:MAG: hypothetical protein ABJF50_17855 [Paracoccaceae bacterium]